MSVLDPQRTYLQVCEHKSLWPYQTVILEGKRYCLSRMSFGLNVAPSIMQAIVEATLSKDDAVWQTTSAYIDDVFINEDIASATRVRQHLANFRLAGQEPEWLLNGARVLGLTVREEGKMLIWERGNVLSVPQVFTRWSVLSFCGKLVGHFSVIKWLEVAEAFFKRAADTTKGWDDEVTGVPLTTMITEVVARVRQEDLVGGKRCVAGPEFDVWVDASSLAPK